MNIYDEAIEDCEFLLGEHENYRILKALERAKKVEEELEEYKISDKSKEDSSILYYNLYKEAKRKLKKVEELLELYRKYANTLYKNALEGVKDSMFRAGSLAYKLYQQIKALEEELK